MKLPAVRTAVLLGVVAVVVPIGPTLAHWHLFQQGDPIDQINPGPLGMAHFGKILSCEVNFDDVPDVYVEDAGEPKLVVWPATHKNAHGIGVQVSDFDVFRGYAPGQDVLFTVDGYGLRGWAYDVANDEFDEIEVPDAGAESPWAGALLVRVLEVDGQNGKDFVGVAGNGNDVLVMLNDGDDTFTPGTGYTNTYDIYDMVVVNWRETGDTAGTDEIATFTPSNWQVREPSGGQILKTTAFSVSTIYGCAVKWGGATECLALIARSSGADWLATYGTGGFTDGPYSLGDVQVTSMTAGDANNDGLSDIFLVNNTDRKFHMHLQDDTTPLFTGVAPTKITYGPSSRPLGQNDGVGLAVWDFDGDGYDDVVAPAQGHLTGMITAYGTLVFKQLGFGTPESLKVGVGDPTYNFLPNPDQLGIELFAPQTEIPVDAGNVAKLRVDVWKTSDLQGVTTPRTTIKTDVIDLPTEEESVTFWFDLPAGYNPMAGGSFETFSLVMRQVEVEEDDETETVLDEGPARVYMWVPQRHYATLAAASDVEAPTLTIGIDTEDVPPSGGGGSGPTTPPPPDGSTPKR